MFFKEYDVYTSYIHAMCYRKQLKMSFQSLNFELQEATDVSQYPFLYI